MSKLPKKELSKELTERALEAMKRCWEIVPPRRKSDAVLKLCAELGLDWRTLELRDGIGVGYWFKRTIAFGVEADGHIAIGMNLKTGRPEPQCTVSWPATNTRDMSRAQACAKLNADMSAAVAMCQLVIADTFGETIFKGQTPDTCAHAWDAAERNLFKQAKHVGDLLDKHRP